MARGLLSSAGASSFDGGFCSVGIVAAGLDSGSATAAGGALDAPAALCFGGSGFCACGSGSGSVLRGGMVTDVSPL